MKDAIIAVCSTVIGTVVGWILGKINIGRLHIALSDFSEEFHYTDPLSIYIPGKKDHELYSVKLSFKVRLYNSSSISKTIRDCTLEFFDDTRNLLFECQVKDNDSRIQHPYGAEYKSIEVKNVGAYESCDVNSVVWISDIDKMYKARTIKFRYSNAKFKKRYLQYKTIDFQKVPRFDNYEESKDRRE